MDCASATCPPISTGWSALVLWTVTFYGVLLILSVFATIVHRQAPTAMGARVLRSFALANGVGLAASPIVIIGVFAAPAVAALVMLVELALALICRSAARRSAPPLTPPRARARRGLLRDTPRLSR